MTPPLSLNIPPQSVCTSGPQEARRALAVTAWLVAGMADGGPGLCVFCEGGTTPRVGRADATRDMQAGDNWLRWDERHWIKRPSPGCTP